MVRWFLFIFKALLTLLFIDTENRLSLSPLTLQEAFESLSLHSAILLPSRIQNWNMIFYLFLLLIKYNRVVFFLFLFNFNWKFAAIDTVTGWFGCLSCMIIIISLLFKLILIQNISKIILSVSRPSEQQDDRQPNDNAKWFRAILRNRQPTEIWTRLERRK